MESEKSQNESELPAAAPHPQQHSCPYAAALEHRSKQNQPHHDKQRQPTDSASSFASDDEDSSQDTSKLLQSCPVFRNGSCPFKDCQNEDQVRQALLQIPPSHYDDSASPSGGGSKASFISVLKELHAVAGQQQQQQQHSNSSTVSDTKFQLLACPVASKLPASELNLLRNNNATNYLNHPSSDAAACFTRVMEGYSLAAIMARMASEIEDEEEHSEDDDEEEEDSNRNIKNAGGDAGIEQELPMIERTAVKVEDAQQQQPKQTIHPDEPASEEAKKQRPRSSAVLSESFKIGTAVSHQAAEDVHFVRNFIKGEIDRTLYTELVVQLYHVYEKMEDCLLSTQHPALDQFRQMHHQLQRTEALREDVDFWHGPAEAARIFSGTPSHSSSTSPAAQDYRDRLEFCRAHDPLLLLAHSYTRYLGDLSGGKILARVARRALQLARDSSDGLAFYEFAAIPSAKKFKDQFRAALDQLELTDAQVQRLVAEANVAFLLNMRLFEELDVMANVPGSKVRPLSEALAYQQQQQLESMDRAAASGECPFAKPSKQSEVSSRSSKEIPAECPFAKMDAGATGKSTTTTTTTAMKKGRCPWPFILAHDPVAALQDWQTWALIGIILCWCYSKL